jgi:hypothetical protein
MDSNDLDNIRVRLPLLESGNELVDRTNPLEIGPMVRAKGHMECRLVRLETQRTFVVCPSLTSLHYSTDGAKSSKMLYQPPLFSERKSPHCCAASLPVYPSEQLRRYTVFCRPIHLRNGLSKGKIIDHVHRESRQLIPLTGDTPAFVSETLILTRFSSKANLVPVDLRHGVTVIVQVSPKVGLSVSIVLVAFHPGKSPVDWGLFNLIPNIRQ